MSRDEIATWLGVARTEGEGEGVVFGSRTTWNGLYQQGLVNELHVMIGPNAIGSGTPLFKAPTRLDLLDVQRFEDSPNAVLRYATPS